MSLRLTVYLLVFLALCLFTGWTLSSSSTPQEIAALSSETGSRADKSQHVFTSQKTSKNSSPAVPKGAISKERILTFNNTEDLSNFLNSAEQLGVKVLYRSPFSNSLRVAYSDYQTLMAAISGKAQADYNYYVSPPTLQEGALASGVVGFRGREKEWLGIHTDNSEWGRGVKVAIIDTGLLEHSAFGDDIDCFSLVDENSDSIHPHGAAMTGLWRTGDDNIPAISPAADLVSIQVAGEDGISNTLLLADAIILATNEGADVITISMGSSGTTATLDEAISYAKSQGALIVSAAGNNGDDTIIFPAAHPDTVAIGAVGYNGNHTGFSNIGEHIDFVAPGVEVITAGAENSIVGSTGTSPAAQIGAAVIVATMTLENIDDPYLANELVQANLNESGLPGHDPYFGNGKPQIDVIDNHDTPGRHDGAIATTLLAYEENSSAPQIQIIIDNPGTEPLSGSTLYITTGEQTYSAPVETIQPKESYEYNLPLSAPSDSSEIAIRAHLELKDGLEDIRPQDNSVLGQFSFPTNQ